MRPATQRELREWMGMTRADMCVYVAFVSLAAMFVVQNTTIDMVLSLSAILLAVAACFLGMKSDPEFEDITNLFKAVAYPAALLVVVLVIAIHYALISTGHADYAGYGVSDAVERVNDFFRNLPGNL